MSIYSILVINTAPGCNNQIEQQVSVSGCTSYIVRLSSNSNALGPFDVYADSQIYYSAVSRNDMFNGVVVTFECVTPTPTPTPTTTPTPTPTITSTITPTPSATIGTTPTPTPTTTHTPTPSSTPQVFEILIFTQDGQQLVTQEGNSLITEQDSYAFSVTSGDTTPESACGGSIYNQILYSTSLTWEGTTNLFTDSSLINEFNGGSNWYSNGTNARQINSSGLVVGTFDCSLS